MEFAVADQAPYLSSNSSKAKARLDAALERLEQAAGQQSTGAEGQAKLAKDLGAAEGEIDSLKSAQAQVSERLDAAIGRVKALIGD